MIGMWSLISYHCLLQCDLFHIPRFELINSITSIVLPYNLVDVIVNQEIYLYGHRSISCENNKKIIISTIKYIVQLLNPIPPPPPPPPPFAG